VGILDNNSTLITGGGSGLGHAIVARFTKEGANVGVLERSPEKAEQLEAKFGSAVNVTVGDVRSAEDNAAAVANTVNAFGKLDTFIGNAGLWDFGTSLINLPLETLGAAFDDLYGVNVKGYLLGARASVDALRESDGSMIFTLSNAAFYAGGGGPLYVSSKHAIVGLIAQLAWELENEVRVNGVAPGAMSTDLRGVPSLGQDQTSFGTLIDSMGGGEGFAKMIGKTFFPTPDDYVMGYVLLASRESRTTNGAILQMHGMLSAPAKPPT
jgi:2,3-dihydroxy-2,3-dihydrophenylpropionate dehydrogenase/cis-2,3-dihydrobiphenyl-2,3-diol dehydrogenase